MSGCAMDVLIKNAKIIDGTGKPAYKGDLGISNGKILLKGLSNSADCVIDAEGKYLMPGFIDAHSHADRTFGAGSYGDLCKINQGITTQLAGQCGDTYAPINPKIDPIGLPVGLGEEFLTERRKWTTWSKYMDYLESIPMTVNCKIFVGFNAIRIAVMGYDDREPTAEELERMKGLLRDAMESGAVGMSSGLAYVPATYSKKEELIEMAKVLKEYGGIYTSHIRNESWDLTRAVEEAIDIGRQTGVSVNISHFKSMGRSNWGKHVLSISAIEKARQEGIDVTCDQYPYNCSMTTYAPCMPQWYFSDGMDKVIELLKDPAMRKQIQSEMEDPATDYENLYLNAGGWNGITVCTSPNVPEAEGITIAEYAKRIGKAPFDAYFDLMIANEGAGTAVYHSISDDDIYDIIRLPYTMVGSDGVVAARYEKCHPRGWGTMVRAICAFAKEKSILPLEALIHKMTGLTAERYSLKGKGIIAEGYDADLVLMDYENLKDNATYEAPTELAGGIDAVFVNGVLSYCNGALTGKHAGKLIR